MRRATRSSKAPGLRGGEASSQTSAAPGRGSTFLGCLPGAALCLERDSCDQLNLPRGQRGCHSAEGQAGHVAVHRTKIRVIEHIQEIKTQLKIPGLTEPR